MKNDSLRKQIEKYYLPSQLVEAIEERGEIPKDSEEALVGIGFLDISDYTFLSKFLSAKENQIVLNGLYSAFNWVLEKHGGYLNKLEGDSLMFQYGGPIDPKIRGLNNKEIERYIAHELFYTCIELQRVCILFNQANDHFLYTDDKSIKEDIHKAFEIIGNLRSNEYIAPSINALFQIRIRIGASIGHVQIGNFGPRGSKHWDIIGMSVIEAKRMESSAPVGGLRISETLYKSLDELGIVDIYYKRFLREAQALSSIYQNIAKEEVFRFSKVYLKEKGAAFSSYSVQVEPNLPEELTKQIDFLLQKEEIGVNRIIDIIKYYRGNRFFILCVEKLFHSKKIHLRKDLLLKLLLPQEYYSLLSQSSGDLDDLGELIENQYDLNRFFSILGGLQDRVKSLSLNPKKDVTFKNYSSYIDQSEHLILDDFDKRKVSIAQKSYFYNYLYPLFFMHMKGSLLEYQFRLNELAEL